MVEEYQFLKLLDYDEAPRLSNKSVVQEFLKQICPDKKECRDIVGQYLEYVHRPFIHEYARNTIAPDHGINIQIMEVFEINRPQDQRNFRANLENRCLLWHGTKEFNVMSILLNGFNIDKSNAGCMFGKGVYMSDCLSKAAQYASPFYIRNKSINSGDSVAGYMFLSEVALGKIKTCTTANHLSHVQLGGFNSVWGVGQYSPSYATSKYTGNILTCAGPLFYYGDRKTTLKHNEYIVYNTNQIHLRYVIKVRYIQVNTIPPTINGVELIERPENTDGKHVFWLGTSEDQVLLHGLPLIPNPNNELAQLEIERRKRNAARQLIQQRALDNATLQRIGHIANQIDALFPKRPKIIEIENVPSTSNAVNPKIKDKVGENSDLTHLNTPPTSPPKSTDPTSKKEL